MRIAFAALLLTAVLPALAADNAKPSKPREPDPKQMARRMVENLERDLSLTAEQAKTVAVILEESLPAAQALRKKLQEHERQLHEKIRAVLNEEQREKFDMARAHQRMPRGQDWKGGEARPPRSGDEAGPGKQDDGDRPGVMIDRGDEPENPPSPRRKKSK